jgi:outer membrane protein assembly factor BamB
LSGGERCFIVQPGVLNLTCLVPETGRLHWQKPIVGLRRLAGLVHDRLIVQTDGDLVCVDAASGKEQWRHAAPALLGPPLCGGPGGLMYVTSRASASDKDLHQPILVWVDLETGRETTRCPLEMRQAEPRLDPLFVAGGRLWAFSGKRSDQTRDLIELVPKGQDLPAAVEPQRLQKE